MNKPISRWSRIQALFQRKPFSWLSNLGQRISRLLRKVPLPRKLRLKGLSEGVEHFVGLILRLGTLALVIFFIVFVVRLFEDHGYVLDQFSVPKALNESGYSGQVVALRIHDEVVLLKELAGSIKEDSLELQGIQEDLNLDVLGVGLSLRSLAYQLRAILGKENKTIRGGITRVGDRYEMKLRMSGFVPSTMQVFVEEGDEAGALDRLFRHAGEQIIRNTDPYRLALICNNEERYDEAIDVVREMIRNRPEEAHWAYLAWGSILENRGEDEKAVARFEKATELNPDFSLGWLRLSYALENVNRSEEAIASMRKMAALVPDECWRINSLAWLLDRNDYHEEADSVFAQALAIAKTEEDRAGICLNWMESKFNREDMPGALALIEEYEEEIGESVLSYLTKAYASVARGDTLQAIGYVGQAFDLDPSHRGAISVALGGSYALGKYDQTISFYRRANLENHDRYERQNVYNRVSMSFNMLEQHDSAFATVQQAIAFEPTMGYPYSTLAETFAFTGQMDSCWFYLEKAFQLGMDPDGINLEHPPYPRLSTMPEFQALVDEYGEPEDEMAD